MKIAIVSDHAGYQFKQTLKDWLLKEGYDVLDFGCESTESMDYPDTAIPAAECVAQKRAERGILICGTGEGMCMVANKVTGVRAGIAYNEDTAALIRLHNDANIVCLGARAFEEAELIKFVQIFLITDFEGGRHQGRVDKINALDTAGTVTVFKS
jgi:ribose 5-phosphate isomerase B